MYQLLFLLPLVMSLPYREKISLHNSLQVGRIEDPMLWQCAGCSEQTKPITSHIIENKAKDIRALLSVYDQYTVLAFRYTATLKNLWQDIIYALQRQDQHSCSGCKVQRQYDNMWNTVRDQIISDLQKSSHTGRLVITGISLGGGLAAISHVDIAQAKVFDNIQLVTYGSPKVGNKKWAQWFDKQVSHTRIYLKNDPIPVFPVCITPICNYRQSGTAYICQKNEQTCKRVGVKQEEENNKQFPPVFQMASQIYEHLQEDKLQKENLHGEENGFITGIYDHIFNYKTLVDFDLFE